MKSSYSMRTVLVKSLGSHSTVTLKSVGRLASWNCRLSGCLQGARYEFLDVELLVGSLRSCESITIVECTSLVQS